MSEALCLPLGQAERLTLETVCIDSRRGPWFERLLGGLRFVPKVQGFGFPVSYACFRYGYLDVSVMPVCGAGQHVLEIGSRMHDERGSHDSAAHALAWCSSLGALSHAAQTSPRYFGLGSFPCHCRSVDGPGPRSPLHSGDLVSVSTAIEGTFWSARFSFVTAGSWNDWSRVNQLFLRESSLSQVCHSFLTGSSQLSHKLLTVFFPQTLGNRFTFLTSFSQLSHRFLTAFSQLFHRLLTAFLKKPWATLTVFSQISRRNNKRIPSDSTPSAVTTCAPAECD